MSALLRLHCSATFLRPGMNEESTKRQRSLGIVKLCEGRSSYVEQLRVDLHPSNTIVFRDRQSPDENETSGTEESVDTSAAAVLALFLDSDPELIFEEWQYVSLVTSFSVVHDLVVTYADDVRISTLDFLFDAAYDAGVLRYHLDTALSNSFTNSSVLQPHLLSACRRIHDLGGGMELYTSEDTVAWTLPRALNLTPSTFDNDYTWVGKRDDFYREEVDKRIRSLLSAKARLTEVLQSYGGIWYDELKDVQQKVNYLNLAIRRLRSRRNTLSPIFRLPPEVLCHIFVHASYISSTYGKYPHSLAWVKVSHVCEYWFEIARNNPQLWANIPALIPQWTEEMLIRSKAIPLRVHYKYDHTNIEHTSSLNIALKHLDRIVDLAIEVNSHDQPFLDAERPAPVLESLSLSLYHGPDSRTFLRRLFKGVTPRLRHMTLCMGCFDLGSPIFRNLTFLELQDTYIGSHIPMEDFVVSLTMMPMLNELHLRDSIPNILLEPRRLQPVERAFHLPSLSKLLLYESAIANSINFMNRIVIGGEGRKAVLDLSFTIHSLRELPRTLLVSVARLTKNMERSLRSLRISQRNQVGLLLEAWTSVDGPIMPHDIPELRLWLRAGPSTHLQADLASALIQTIYYLPFSGVSMVAATKLDLKNAWPVIGRMRNIHAIYISGTSPAALLSALMRDLQIDRTISQTENIFSALRILLFHDVSFGNGGAGIRQLTTLAEIIVKRRQLGGPVQSVIHVQFDRCRGITEANALALRKIVPNVAWEAREDDIDNDEFDDYFSDY